MQKSSVHFTLFVLFFMVSCSHKAIQTLATAPQAIQDKVQIVNPQARNQTQQFSKPTVVLISLDGFRADYLERYHPPHLSQLMQQGLHAKGLIPIYPSLTFPNHYTLVTGLTADHHGLIGNHFYDPLQKREYHVGDISTTDGSWYKGTPLWVAATKNGLLSASYFWVGSEAEIDGHRPDEYYNYDESVPNNTRVDKVLEWLRRPEETRPHMITVYFSDVDTMGHLAGPDSEAVKQAIFKLDQDLARLFDETEKMPFPVDVIVVSDHGMENIDPLQRGRPLDDFFDEKDFKVFVNGGTQVYFYAHSADKIQPTFLRLKHAEHNFHVYLKKDIPERFHLKNNPSTPDILVSADLSYSLGLKNKLKNAKSGGAHGYEPKNKEMWGVFIARGPQFKANKTLPAIDNINVAPLVLRILGITPEHRLDGSSRVFNKVLVDDLVGP